MDSASIVIQTVTFSPSFTWNMTCARIGEVWRLAAMPLELLQISDILLAQAHPLLLLFHTAHACAFDPLTQQELSLAQLAHEATPDSRALDANSVAIPSAQLIPLLEDCTFFNFRMCDLEHFDEETAIAGVLMIEDQRFEQPVLPRLPLSSLYFDSHDDCYIYLETRRRDCARQVAVRAFQTYVGTQLLITLGAPHAVPALPEPLFDALWPATTGNLTLPPAATTWAAGTLSIGVSFTEYSFHRPEPYPIDALLTYTPATRHWALQPCATDPC